MGSPETIQEKDYIRLPIGLLDMEEVLKKVVLLGDSAVGKTSLMNRFIHNEFKEKYISTVGARVSKKVVNTELSDKEYSVNIMVWDIIGSEGYESTQSRHIAGLNGGILVSDLSRPETIKKLGEYWLPLLSKTTGDMLPPVLYVGNKLDIANETVAAQTPKVFSEIDKGIRETDAIDRYRILNPYVLTSAKTGVGVEEGFRTLAIMMMMEHHSFDPLTRQMDEMIAESIYAEDERKTARSVLDMIVADFPFVVQSSEVSSTILQDCFSRTEMSKDNPNPEGIREIIDCLMRLALDKGAKEKVVEQYRKKWTNTLSRFG
jgi:small GTP-binding protein